MAILPAYSGLLNPGESTLSGLRDSVISGRIIGRLPQGTFTSVFCQSLQHDFATGEGKVPSKKIVLSRTFLDTSGEVMRAFFMAIFGNSIAEQARYSPATTNGNLIVDHILVVQDAETNREIQKIYLNCQQATIYVSDNCNYCSFELSSKNYGIVLARKIGNAKTYLVSLIRQ